jgi:ABC-type sugar transport system ATPase subunit
MNLLRLPLAGRRARLGPFELEVPELAGEDEIVLGLRPHELLPGSDLELRVEWVEEQGDRQVVEASVAEQRLRLSGAFAAGLAPGMSVGIALRAAPWHWFHPRTGARLGAA